MSHFVAPSVFDRIRELQQQLRTAVQLMDEDRLMTPELAVDELVERFCLVVPELHVDRRVVVERREVSPGVARVVVAGGGLSKRADGYLPYLDCQGILKAPAHVRHPSLGMRDLV